jgi:hypothetical protein
LRGRGRQSERASERAREREREGESARARARERERARAYELQVFVGGSIGLELVVVEVVSIEGEVSVTRHSRRQQCNAPPHPPERLS